MDFKRQRECRKVFKSAIKKSTLGLIDLGSSKIVCVVLRFANQIQDRKVSEQLKETTRLPYRVVGVATKKSRGIKSGEVILASEAEKSIRSVVQQAQKMAGTTIDDILVCFAGGHPISRNLFGELKVQNSTVEKVDIGALLSKYRFDDYLDNREILHAMPINFTLDDKTGLTDPCGLVGQTLGLDINLITINKNVLFDLVECFKRCQLNIAGIVFSPYVSARSSLVEDELKLGAACIDLGSGSTGSAIFTNQQLVFASLIRLGGEHITSDIMQAFQISFEEAERIKTLHGGVVVTNLDDNELIELTC